jgi:uncharacterized protein (TIGR03437 family)
LDGVRVLFDGIPGPLAFVSAGQINVQLPWQVLGGGSGAGNVSVVVERNGVASAPMQFQVGATAPGIFSVSFGTGTAIAINPDGSLSAPEGSIPGFPTRPTRRGEVLIILATGLGETNPGGITGSHSLNESGGFVQRDTVARPTVLIGGETAQLFFSGLSPQFVGVNQLNVAVPATAPIGAGIPLQIRMGDFTSTNQVTVAIAAAQ